MGACLSLKYGRYNQDLTGSTFSHYSLNSDSSYLDLYPALRYAETGASLTEIDEIQWRRSSVPLMTDWSSMGNVSHFDHSPSLPSPVPTPHPALRPCDSLTTISVREGSAKHGQDESGNGFYWAGQPTSNGLVSRFQNSSTFLLSWETKGGGVVRRLRRSTTLQYEKVEGDHDQGDLVPDQGEEEGEHIGQSVLSLENNTVEPEETEKYIKSSSCHKL